MDLKLATAHKLLGRVEKEVDIGLLAFTESSEFDTFTGVTNWIHNRAFIFKLATHSTYRLNKDLNDLE
jgi:hypothetical protein